MGKHILVVDDDPTVCGFIQRYLTKQGFNVITVPNGELMRRQMSSKTFDLIVLDLMLPGEDGLELTRHVRETSTIPIIMVTARTDTVDRIIGLEMGADDYLPKPFDARELLARIKSVLRRAENPETPMKDGNREGVLANFSDWELDTEVHNLTSPQGETVHLTAGEFDLLSVFVKYPGKVLSREQILDFSKGHGAYPYDRSIDVQVLRLRRKIEQDPRHPQFIKTEQGAGYFFTPKVKWS